MSLFSYWNQTEKSDSIISDTCLIWYMQPANKFDWHCCCSCLFVCFVFYIYFQKVHLCQSCQYLDHNKIFIWHFILPQTMMVKLFRCCLFTAVYVSRQLALNVIQSYYYRLSAETKVNFAIFSIFGLFMLLSKKGKLYWKLPLKA